MVEEKGWYASTLELQLVSLEFRGVCRNVQTSDVGVDRRTPPRLWSPLEPHDTPNRCSQEISMSSRVPVVEAFGLGGRFRWTFCRRGLQASWGECQNA
ncbi:unnamed protein product, partial [Ectocarpus sp. 12 AP-2014]